MGTCLCTRLFACSRLYIPMAVARESDPADLVEVLD
jgi:hypothetical protein